MLVIGIAGGSGCGKSTFVRNVIKRLPPEKVALISQDNYYNDNSHLTMEERHKLNFDHPNSIDFNLLIEQLTILKNGNAIAMPQYSYLTCTRSNETITIEPKPIIIVEGMMSLVRKELRDLLDISIFIDVDDDERLIRCIQRDIEERGRNVASVVDRYQKTVKPMHLAFIAPSKYHADVIVPRGGENIAARDMIVKMILQKILNE
ncbi:UNVERIFIED_CONTAM: hypothetical protein GTU68_040302 [Idotea baltica]|nr:hypothetical protein [Idotea baltica]